MNCLVILSPGFPSDENDSTCLPAQQEFVRALNRNFPALKIVVIASHYPYRREQYTWNGNQVIATNGKRSAAFKPLLWFRIIRILFRVRREHKSIGVLTFWFGELALAGAIFSRLTGVRHKIWLLGQDARKGNIFVNLVRPKPDDIISLSPFLSEHFFKNYRIQPAHLVTNGIVPPIPESGAKRSIDILGVGSLIPLKQYSIFIDVVQQIQKEIPEVKTILVGNGEEQNSLSTRIRTLGLSNNIELPGEQSHKQVLSLMSRAKILLHPSAYEGFSSACLEALSAGCHVVSFTYAEEVPVRHWHLVKDTGEMVARCLEILATETDFTPVVPRLIDDSARRMIEIFNGETPRQ